MAGLPDPLPTDDGGRSQLVVAIADPANTSVHLTALRHRAAAALAGGLTELGNRLWKAGADKRDLQTVGIAMVTQMAGELAHSAVESFAAGRWYAGNTAVRQLLEDHYLLTHFARDPAEAERWATASTQTIEHEFMPRHMRRANGFDPIDYRAHCTWGGHPNPAGGWLLRGHAPLAPLVVAWADLMQHLADIAEALLACMAHIPVASDTAQANEELILGMARMLDSWRVGDPLSARPRPLLREDVAQERSSETRPDPE